MQLARPLLVALSLATASACSPKKTEPARSAEQQAKLDQHLSADVQAIVDAPDSMRLMRLKPGPEQGPGPELHGWEILGEMAVANADDQAKVREALYGMLIDGPEYGSRCFNPRHGIVARKGQHSVEAVICFECSNAEIFTPGGRVSATISGGALELEDLLTKAGIDRPPPGPDRKAKAP